MHQEQVPLLNGSSESHFSQKIELLVGLLKQLDISEGKKDELGRILAGYLSNKDAAAAQQALKASGIREELFEMQRVALETQNQAERCAFSIWQKALIGFGVMMSIGSIVLGIEAISDLLGKGAVEATGHMINDVCGGLEGLGTIIYMYAKSCLGTSATDRFAYLPLSVSGKDAATALKSIGGFHSSSETALAPYAQRVGLMNPLNFMAGMRCSFDGYFANVTAYAAVGGRDLPDRALTTGLVVAEKEKIFVNIMPQIGSLVMHLAAELKLFIMPKLCLTLEQGGASAYEGNMHIGSFEREAKAWGNIDARLFGAFFGIATAVALMCFAGAGISRVADKKQAAREHSLGNSLLSEACTLWSELVGPVDDSAAVPIRATDTVDRAPTQTQM